jgi:hypothetical protein
MAFSRIDSDRAFVVEKILKLSGSATFAGTRPPTHHHQFPLAVIGIGSDHRLEGAKRGRNQFLAFCRKAFLSSSRSTLPFGYAGISCLQLAIDNCSSKRFASGTIPLFSRAKPPLWNFWYVFHGSGVCRVIHPLVSDSEASLATFPLL